MNLPAEVHSITRFWSLEYAPVEIVPPVSINEILQFFEPWASTNTTFHGKMSDLAFKQLFTLPIISPKNNHTTLLRWTTLCRGALSPEYCFLVGESPSCVFCKISSSELFLFLSISPHVNISLLHIQDLFITRFSGLYLHHCH